ncbi:MAG: hypothetical protein LBI34_03755 [Puniceicoccales bacterium]|jgi:hypothetical protein|nr:hypothetical protein [Puniceicoccales bacterium]
MPVIGHDSKFLLSHRIQALAEAWRLVGYPRAVFDLRAGEHSGAVVYYDGNGNRCTINEGLATEELKKAVEMAANDAVVVHLGGNQTGSAMLWLVKGKEHIPLAERLNREMIGNHRSAFQCLVGPNMQFITHESTAPPEPWAQRILCKISDGGFSAAVMSFGALITFFATAAFSGVTNWAPLGVSLVLFLVGLFIGCVGQFFYRRLVAPETTA